MFAKVNPPLNNKKKKKKKATVKQNNLQLSATIAPLLEIFKARIGPALPSPDVLAYIVHAM